jgi:hypothetical protein
MMIRGKRMTSSPTGLYVITHANLQAVKVGMGTEERIATFRRLGWETQVHIGPFSVQRALAVEQHALRVLRKRFPEPCLTQQDIPSGWTETFPLSEVPIEQVIELFREAGIEESEVASPYRSTHVEIPRLVSVDSRGRLSVTRHKLFEPGRTYEVEKKADGTIVFYPVRIVRESESGGTDRMSTEDI